jgi:phosphoglycerate dehydrogenase-like enzyme
VWLADSPYCDLENVIVTPHMAGISQGAYQRITDLFCENLRRYLAGEDLLNVVDKQIGSEEALHTWPIH